MDEDQFFKLVGERLRLARIEKGFTAYDKFAFTCDLPRQTILRAEMGNGIQLRTLYKILTALEVSPAEFFKDIK
jgi:transcriptional regulator with XRE-family HTH domain